MWGNILSHIGVHHTCRRVTGHPCCLAALTLFLACHLYCVDSSNPHRWRGKQLHHHGGGVCWLFVLLWIDS